MAYGLGASGNLKVGRVLLISNSTSFFVGLGRLGFGVLSGSNAASPFEGFGEVRVLGFLGLGYKRLPSPPPPFSGFGLCSGSGSWLFGLHLFWGFGFLLSGLGFSGFKLKPPPYFRG